MLKNIQIKVLLIFIILGIIFSAAAGVIVEKYTNIENIYFIYIIIVTLILFIISGFVVAKLVTLPILRIFRNADNNGKTRYLSDGKKEDELDMLISTFAGMNTELTENLREVTRQKNQMETILLHMTDGIVAVNTEGKIIHINPTARELLGITKNVKSYEEVFDPLKFDINLEKVIYLENWTSTEKKVVLGDKTISLFFAPYRNEEDILDGVIIVIQDITAHEKLNSMRKQFVADVSHELKTPITSILGYSETLLDNEVDEETNKKFLERISHEANRMSALVSDLLTLSRYDSTQIKAEKTSFDFGELVKETYESLQFEIEKKNQESECYITGETPMVYADKSGIQRVIINILTNAIKYTPENGRISISVGTAYSDAYVKIRDTGIGIPEEDLQRIFERFYRVDKARTREMGGTGLGLSIAKEILNQNNGRIDIQSKVGEGTSVVIRIPLKKD